MTCVNGFCTNDTALQTFKCNCNAGFSGTYCQTSKSHHIKLNFVPIFVIFIFFKESFTCTQVGNFPDPVKCFNYYQCTVNPDGTYNTNLIKCTTKTLSTGATLQYLYDPALGLCVLPSKFPNNYTGQTCTTA